MKLKKLAILSLFALCAPVMAAGGHEHDHAPKFGGVVVETRVGDVEIVARPDVIRIHLSDHGKPVKIDGARAKVTLLNGAEKSDVELAPAGDRLEAKGSFKVTKGTKGVAVVTLQGKAPATARFEVK